MSEPNTLAAVCALNKYQNASAYVYFSNYVGVCFSICMGVLAEVSCRTLGVSKLT